MVEVQSTNLNFHHHLLVWNTLPLSLRNYQFDKLASYLSHCSINYGWKVGNLCSQNMWVRDLLMHTPEWLTTLIIHFMCMKQSNPRSKAMWDFDLIMQGLPLTYSHVQMIVEVKSFWCNDSFILLFHMQLHFQMRLVYEPLIWSSYT